MAKREHRWERVVRNDLPRQRCAACGELLKGDNSNLGSRCRVKATKPEDPELREELRDSLRPLRNTE